MPPRPSDRSAARPGEDFSRRERQIIEVLYRLGEAGAAEVIEGMLDPSSYSSVRATLRIMEEKGYLVHRKDGPRYLYRPVRSRGTARRSALKGLVENFFGGSPEEAFAALLDLKGREMKTEELTRLEKLVRRAREEGR